MLEVSLNGFTDVPPGKVANIATYLEMTEAPELKPSKANGLTLEPMDPPSLTRYRALFEDVGADWLWFSRLTLDEDVLKAAIENPAFEIFALRKEGRDVGLLELDVRDPANIELAYFGVVQSEVGTGAGHFLMNAAIERAFSHHKTRRFFVHTCTMDHPAALSFYMKSGFTPYKRAIEIADDPRLTGHIGCHLGRHHPIIE
ncbi:MAG: GNAT family N-acetyltransferase [Pseudomonadota bacterium]